MPKGCPVLDETKQAIIDKVREEIEAYQRGEIKRLSTNPELGELVGIPKWSIRRYLEELPEELRSYRFSKIRGQTSREVIRELNADPEFQKANTERLKVLNADPEFQKAKSERSRKVMLTLNADPEFQKANSERGREIMKSLHADPEFQKATIERMKKLNADPEFQKANTKRLKVLNADPQVQKRRREALDRLNTDPEFKEAHRKIMKALHADPEFQKANRERGKIRGINFIDNLRKNGYHIDGRFYTSSMQEGAVALLLEKYIQDYKIKNGNNFQVRNKHMNNGGIDFLVNEEFLEWHPIALMKKLKAAKGRGDIPEEEYASYFNILSNLTNEEKAQFQEEYRKVLALNYICKRQADVDNSGYAGANVALARDVGELYDFMCQHSDKMPSFDEFRREFNAKVKYVKGFKVEKKEKSIEEVN
jgi:hypothetical protein